MSVDAGGARGSAGSAGPGGGGGGSNRGSIGSGGPGATEQRGSVGSAGGGARGSTGEGRGSTGGPKGSAGEARASAGSGGEARGSVGSAGEKRASGGSAGGARVSFDGEGGGARGSKGSGQRGSQGSAGGRYPGEVQGEQAYYGQEAHGEDCSCEDCICPAEEDAKPEDKPAAAAVEEQIEVYQLDEFMRAKSYFQQVSSKSGLSMYDHLSEVIRKFLDERAPNNPVDYLEEVSMNVKRYRFGLKKEDPLQDSFFVSDGVLKDAQRLFDYWKNFAKWSEDRRETPGEGDILPGGSFQNLLRLQYYLEQVNIGLSREEMFRLALGIKELSGSRSQIGKLRFWGKIFGTQGNYYVVEAELKFGGTDQAMDLWNPKDDGNDGGGRGSDGSGKNLEMNAVQTFGRAKDVVLNHEFLQAYSKSSGLSPDKQAALLPTSGQGRNQTWEGEGAPAAPTIQLEDSGDRADSMKWESYQQELMQSFPQSKTSDSTQVPAEQDGSGVNRRVFYVCSELGEDWALLPPVTPQQINASRKIRWFLTGKLDNPVKSIPSFPGREGHYLKALLVRITAGAMCSPKGYFRSRPGEGELPGEEDDEELAGEDDEPPQAGNDAIQPVKKYKAAMKALTNPNLSFWVHHTSHILQQGRTVWWNPAGSKAKQRRGTSDFGSEMEDNSEMEEEDEEDEDTEAPGKEVGPPLFRSVSEDTAGDGNGPWSLVTSSSVFPEFQVVSLRSNTWPGSYAICTSKGKVANFYCGDGLKFAPISFCPPLSDNPAREYKSGPELEETHDPSVDQEQNWLNKLALKEIEDIEPKFVDNEGGITTGEDDESDYEY